MKFPIITTFCASALAFVACVYVGGEAGKYICHRYKESVAFASLGPQEAPRFRQITQSLFGAPVAIFSENTQPEAISKQITELESLRTNVPDDVRPILDLRIATDHAVIARSDTQAGKSAEAVSHREAARVLLRSLGWKDVSDAALNGLADKAFLQSPGLPL